jgi:serine/threonine protein kinase
VPAAWEKVYLAHDPRLERTVALKILPPDLACDSDRVQRFTREARAASALSHTNVATVYDVGESGGIPFIVMEHVEGHTIAARIAERPLAVTEVVDIAAQVADALDAAHAKGITHRDIKPANLMLTPRGQVKVLDFGIAKMLRSEETPITGESRTDGRTAVGSVIGSAAHMSPEQIMGREVDSRSDLFSLGVSMYGATTTRLRGSTGRSSTIRRTCLRVNCAAGRISKPAILNGCWRTSSPARNCSRPPKRRARR